MKPNICITIAALPVFLTGFEQSLMATSASAIATAVGNSTGMMWIPAAYFIAAAIATPIFGRLGDHFGPVRMLAVSVVIFIAGSVIATQVNSFAPLILARFIQGIGGGGMISLPSAMLSRHIGPRLRAAYQGYLVAVAFMANTLGPALGSYMIASLGWSSVFWFNVPVGFVALTLIGLFGGSDRPRDTEPLRFDWAGAALLAVFVTLLILSADRLARGMGDITFVLAASVAVFAILAFFQVEKRVADPLIPLGLLQNGVVWRCGLITFLYGALFMGLCVFYPVLLRQRFLVPTADLGLMTVPMLGAIGVGSIVTGRLVRRTGLTMVYTASGLTVAGLSIALFAFVFDHVTPGQSVLWMGVVGLFMGSVLGVVQVSLQVGAHAAHQGRAVAFIQLARMIGVSVGAGFGALIYLRSAAVLSGNTAVHTHQIDPTAGALPDATPFTVLFLFFASIALTAAWVASRCRVPRVV